ncbi:wax ester/triacylglycerol synthase family O-acyltransferase [Streptomyces sp. SP17BM10]|uniref:wax ester/triacylglycerol synthase family O-acyltransferase n=1 Tax=Streptomyces sp. SP17BM10 TaxID=3002530 RepID=UPI002E779D45|nr:wax ester/triacylglycerol synthase family O-acyltransferase [Streptomyces sp. SP17BM10]MEE1783613.1 wax ester/triacylglycerol synthase family O-acyltransferase [Streptomyces sp. SP17BM10]
MGTSIGAPGRGPVMERLAPQDLMLLWLDDFGWPEVIGALAILDGARLLDSDGRFRVEAVREVVGSRLSRVPRFRQLLYVPRRGLGRPLWVDAPAFDLSEHVRVLPFAAPPDEAGLLHAVEHVRALPLDRSRPLWEMWFLPGLTGDRVAMFIKVHHTIADGAAGVALLGVFLDPSADAPTVPDRPWTPAPAPSRRDLFDDNLRGHVQATEGTLSKLRRPATTLHQARDKWPAVRENYFKGRAPQTSFNIPVGPHRTLALVRSRLDAVEQIAHSHEVKLNDVLMAAAAGGLRDLLLSRGERVEGLVLRAFVPVSLHQEGSGRARGNRSGMMFVPLPIGEPDPVRRLRLVAAASARQKHYVVGPPEGILGRNRVIQRAMMRGLGHQRWANLYVGNIFGPPVPLHLAGARITEIFPVVPITGNLTLAIAALSYAEQFNIGVVVDANACPDLEVLADGVRNHLQGFGSSRPHAEAG